MKIGISTVYPYRPATKDIIFISRILEKAGHELYYFGCDGSVPTCHDILYRGQKKSTACLKCQYGGIKTFVKSKRYSTLSDYNGLLDSVIISDELAREISKSSSYSIERIESEKDCETAQILEIQDQLMPSIKRFYKASVAWISQNKLDAVIFFNGRIDFTKALLYACEITETRYLTTEVAYPGIRIVPGAYCNNPTIYRKMTDSFKDKPLTKIQSEYAGHIVGRMFKRNYLTWRVYNTEAKPISWPIENYTNKVLILPSSKHEFMGNWGYESAWRDNTDGLDFVLKTMNIDYKDCIVRFHPNWSEKIGINEKGDKSIKHYLNWTNQNEMYVIREDDKADTFSLMDEADIVIVTGGTSGIEGALLGKRVISITPSRYSNAGFSIEVHNKEMVSNLYTSLTNKEIITKALRFIYSYYKRVPQYTEFIEPITTTESKYYLGATDDRIIYALETYGLIPNDDSYADSESYEEIIINMINSRNFDELFNLYSEKYYGQECKIKRRFPFHLLDIIRKYMKIGSR